MVLHASSVARRLALRRERARAAGFTMAEILAVLAITSILAAVATPGFVGMMRDRRTAQETGMFTDAFRIARARALGRGAAVRVRILPSIGAVPGRIQILEHISAVGAIPGAAADGSFSVPGCNAAGAWRVVETFTARRGATQLHAFPHTQPAPAAADLGLPVINVCYTPRGRTLVNYLGTGGDTSTPPELNGYTALDGVVTLRTRRGTEEGADDNNPRRIFVLPNGLTRMAL